MIPIRKESVKLSDKFLGLAFRDAAMEIDYGANNDFYIHKRIPPREITKIANPKDKSACRDFSPPYWVCNLKHPISRDNTGELNRVGYNENVDLILNGGKAIVCDWHRLKLDAETDPDVRKRTGLPRDAIDKRDLSPTSVNWDDPKIKKEYCTTISKKSIQESFNRYLSQNPFGWCKSLQDDGRDDRIQAVLYH